MFADGFDFIRLRHVVDTEDTEVIYEPTFLDQAFAAECYKTLEHEIPWEQRNMMLYGKNLPFPRLVAWYDLRGASYRFSGIEVQSSGPVHPLVVNVLKQVRDSVGVDFNAVLLNFYRNGNDSISWHTDAEPELGENPVVASISLGAARRFQIKRRDNGKILSIDLENGSLLVMRKAMMHLWKHQIPKQPSITQGRINLTFRCMQ